MAENGRVVVGCTHGDDDPDRVAVAYLTAGAALDQGKQVVMWLSVEGGGRFYVCPICFHERALDERELVDGAELKGATPLLEYAGPGALTFNY